MFLAGPEPVGHRRAGGRWYLALDGKIIPVKFKDLGGGIASYNVLREVVLEMCV
jgi:hypothetical protein